MDEMEDKQPKKKKRLSRRDRARAKKQKGDAGGEVIIENRERFSSDRVSNLKLLCGAFLLLSALLGAMVAILAMRNPPPVFFSGRASDRGLVLSIDVANENGDAMTEAELATWLGARLVEMFNFTYADADQRFRLFQSHLSPVAWNGTGDTGSEGYNFIINNEVRMQRLERDRLIVIGTPLAPPLLQDVGRDQEGHFFWDYTVPLKISVNGPPEVSNEIELQMRVRLVPYAEIRRGRIYVRDDPLEIVRIGYVPQRI